MKNNYILPFLLLVFGLVAAMVVVFVVISEDGEDEVDNKPDRIVQENDLNPQRDETNDQDESAQGDTATGVASAGGGIYTDYAENKLDEDKINLIFFHASWCPSCRRLDDDLDKNRAEIPENIQILKADYDDESELKKKYGITLQHTIVQVDGQGNEIQTVEGYYSVYTLEELISSI